MPGEDLPKVLISSARCLQRSLLAPSRLRTIKALLTETGQTLQRLLSFLHVDALEQIPASEFARVEQLLERSKRRAA
jgi:hypothetical protein